RHRAGGVVGRLAVSVFPAAAALCAAAARRYAATDELWRVCRALSQHAPAATGGADRRRAATGRCRPVAVGRRRRRRRDDFIRVRFEGEESQRHPCDGVTGGSAMRTMRMAAVAAFWLVPSLALAEMPASLRALLVVYRCDVVKRLEQIYVTGDPASDRDRFIAV